VLFHVTDRTLPKGTVLRPYAIAQDNRDPLDQAVQVIDEGSEAVATLLAGATGSRLISSGESQAGMLFLEAAFERVRLRIAPDLPSRLGVVFAWNTLADAVHYRDAYQRFGVVHRCAMVAGRSVERDGSLVVDAFEEANLAQPQLADLPRAEERAIRYWRGQVPKAHPEVLVEGTMLVEGIVAASLS
jgi:hypothetical protein